jgi:hypothetical protein
MPTITTTNFIAASALVAISTSTASAVVISFLNQDIAIPATFEGVSLNVETGDFSITLAGAVGGDFNLAFGGAGLSNDADQLASSPSWQPVRVGTANIDLIRNLEFGALVGPGSMFASGYGGSTDLFSTFTPGERGYLGFSVILEDTTVAYGWAEVTLESDDTTPGVIHAWAFEQNGDSIEVGTIPEPTHTLLLALGLMASTFRRHR